MKKICFVGINSGVSKVRRYSAVKVFRPGLIHTIGRFLIFFGTATGKTTILEKVGLILYEG